MEKKKKRKEAARLAQAITNAMPWRRTRHKGSVLWMLHGCKVGQPSPALLARTQPHISKSLLSDTQRLKTTTIPPQFHKYCRISEHTIQGSGWRGTHGDYHRWGSQSTGERHREAQSIHLDRTSKSSNSSLGSRDWSLSRDGLIGSYCCCRGSGSYPGCLVLTTRSHYDPHMVTATCLCTFLVPYFHSPGNGERVYFYVDSRKYWTDEACSSFSFGVYAVQVINPPLRLLKRLPSVMVMMPV